ncbi:MAG: hypothetical protein VX704_09740, partial [Verrucomicrobiota bacterium]|nr:hypothetical protein [Verrucomicrobiota bacterium]
WAEAACPTLSTANSSTMYEGTNFISLLTNYQSNTEISLASAVMLPATPETAIKIENSVQNEEEKSKAIDRMNTKKCRLSP